MTTFVREIYPVGHGGFAFERIGGYSIVFDCGASSSPARVSQYINHLSLLKTGPIDRLYISHFDRDHVNGISELINKVGVREVVVPAIPVQYRVVYDVVTSGAYSIIRNLLPQGEIRLVELEGENTIRKDIWEWIAKPMMTSVDWNNLDKEFCAKNLKINQLSDPVYVNVVKKIVNRCFKEVFGPQGPNSKGLVLLSQKMGGDTVCNTLSTNNNSHHLKATAAFYTGDANLKKKNNVSIVENFVCKHLRWPLALMQIPHHGSQSNASCCLNKYFPASFYYYQDQSSVRIQKNSVLYQSLMANNTLLNVRDVDSDLIHHCVCSR